MALARSPKVRLIDKSQLAITVSRRLEDKADAWLRSDQHLAFVRSHACLACGRTSNVVAAHVWKGNDGAKGEKPSDIFTLPLCATAHLGQLGCHDRQHLIGEITFWTPILGGTDLATRRAVDLAAASPCAKTRRAAANVLAGRHWSEEP